MSRHAKAASVLLAFALSCGGGQTHPNLFSAEWEDDGGATIARLQRRLAQQHPVAGTSVAVAVTGNADQMVGVPLDGGARWTFPHPLDARPIITGTVVIGSGSGEVFALAADSGRKLWTRQTGGLSLRSAGDDGSVTVMTLGRTSGSGSTLLAVLRDGTVVREVETDKILGAPAVLQGLAFVPWANEYISVLDLSSGDEAARVVMREKVSRAFAVGGALYFGEVGFFRFDDRIGGASKNQATHVGLPERELPGTPELMASGYQVQRPTSGAEDKIRLYARPAGDTGTALDSGRYYATYFKLVMGFDGKQGTLAWVHTHPSDVIGGAAAQGSVVLCDEQGKLTMLDARTGAVVGEQDLGQPARACVVQVDAFRPSGAPAGAQTLAAQITEALTNGDQQLVTAQRLLLRELATLPDESVTRTLIDLTSDVRTAPLLLDDARTALAARRTGTSEMVTALGRRYDFLKDVLRPPPVAPIAQALAAMKEKSAASALATHLFEPADTDDDVKQTAAALAVLAGPSELPALRQFFGMYRATAENDDIGAAVVSVAQAILTQGGADGHATVQAAADDALTTPYVKERIDALVKAFDAAAQGGNAKPRP
jgi:outer membrane protein assembly factor BamB